MAKIDHITHTTRYRMNSILVKQEKPRHYLGASGIGDPCARKLFYQFRHASERGFITGRQQRIFDTGHIAEELIVKHLKLIGVDVYDDQTEVKGFHGYALGHCDGVAKGFIEYPDEELLAEFKAVNQKGYEGFIKEGCEKKNIVYYSQVQYYMGKLKLKNCAFIVLNKNTSQVYIEFIPFNNGFYQDLLRKEEDIILRDSPPPRGYPEGFYKCGGCDELAVCELGSEPQRVCRACEHVELSGNGEWTCNRPGTRKPIDLSFGEQLIGCDEWKNPKWN